MVIKSKINADILSRLISSHCEIRIVCLAIQMYVNEQIVCESEHVNAFPDLKS
jgi:hypothetical protein